MTYAGDINNELQDIFHRYKEKQKLGLISTLNDISCCNCAHKTRIRNCKMTNSSSICSRFAFILFILLCMAVFIGWCLRQYLNQNIYGGVALCGNSLFWPFAECPVAF